MSYTIKKNDYNTFYVEEKTRTHTGVRWLTLSNIVDECNTLEEAKQKYPKAKVIDLVKVDEYIPSKEYLKVKINTQSIPEDKFPLLHENLNSLLLNFHSTNILEVSQFYDYFEEFDKDMTMADVLDVRQAMDKFYSAVKGFENSINDMKGDINSLIVDNYPFGLSFDEFSLSFMDWYNSVDDNCNTYRHAIRTVRGKNE